MSTITYPHIEIHSDGVAIISGTKTKVIEIVQDHLAHHWHAEDICRQYPYLSPAQVHAALTYYYDHQKEMEEEIDRRRRRVADIQAKRADRAIEDKLRKLGHLQFRGEDFHEEENNVPCHHPGRPGRLKTPLASLPSGTLTVSVRDRQGNVARIVRTITVGRK
jgi:uncharacterized protein (DUF433 family)